MPHLTSEQRLTAKRLPSGNLMLLFRLLPHIVGNVGFVFTNEDLSEIRDKLLENKVRFLHLFICLDFLIHWIFDAHVYCFIPAQGIVKNDWAGLYGDSIESLAFPVKRFPI